ncbi:hypothetical protein niasHT_028597 [Heterodera trifolii]|uniref:Uncharacterized protein n=1 Tax=Heterodera trifolii TaxID=157864 RepID=A0ABD2KBA7_9BILA
MFQFLYTGTVNHIKEGNAEATISIPFRLRGSGAILAHRGACPQIFKFFPSIILICQRGTAARHGSGRSQQRHHPQFYFICHFRPLSIWSTAETHPKFAFPHLPFSSPSIMPFIAPGTFTFLSKDYGEFSTGQFDPNRAYDPNSLAQLSKWRKEFLDGRYGSKQPSPFSTPRSPSPSFPIPVIVGRQMFPGDDGYESEDDEILLPPPPIPPQIDPPPPNVPAVRVQPMHVGQQRLPLRDLPQFDYHPPNVPAVRVQPMHDGQQRLPLRNLPPPPIPPQLGPPPPNVPSVGVQPMHDGQQRLPLRDLPPPPIPPQLGHPPPNVLVVRVQPMQQPIPLRDVPLFANPPPNVPAVRVQPMHVGQQRLPLRDLPQFDYHPPNVPAVRVQPMHDGQQRLPLRNLPPPPIPPQLGPPPPNVPAVGVQPMHDGQQRLPLRDLPPPPIPPQLGHPPPNVLVVRVQPMQQPIPLRDVPLFANPPPNVPGIRVEPIHEGQQPIPLRVLPQIFHFPPNVPEIGVGPIHAVQQPMPLRDMPQIHHQPRNVTSIGIKLWLLFLSLWVFLQASHVRQIQRDYAIRQFAHQPPNVPLIFEHPPAIQPRQQPLPLRDVLQFNHPLPHGPPNHPNPPRVLEVIRRLREWRGRPQDPRRPPQ